MNDSFACAAVAEVLRVKVIRIDETGRDGQSIFHPFWAGEKHG